MYCYRLGVRWSHLKKKACHIQNLMSPLSTLGTKDWNLIYVWFSVSSQICKLFYPTYTFLIWLFIQPLRFSIMRIFKSFKISILFVTVTALIKRYSQQQNRIEVMTHPSFGRFSLQVSSLPCFQIVCFLALILFYYH